MIRHRTELKTVVISGKSSAPTDPQDGIIVEISFPGRPSKLQSLRPLDLDRGDGKEQRSWKIAFAPERGLRDGFIRGHIGKPLGKIGRGKGVDLHEVDRSSHRRFQAIRWKARDGPDSGFATREFLPVVRLARAERGHDTHAGDDNDRPSEFIAWCCHVPPRLPCRVHLMASTRAMPSPRQCPAPTTTICDGGFGISTSSPVGSLGGNSAPREIESAAKPIPSGN